MSGSNMHAFISHNNADKPYARQLGALLIAQGVDVWFDAWSISAGESIPQALDAGLSSFSHFVLLWSEASSRAPWVRCELDAALVQVMADPSKSIIGLALDDTPFPALLHGRKWLPAQDRRIGACSLIAEITGLAGWRQQMMALQEAMQELLGEAVDDPMMGFCWVCPKCGASAKDFVHSGHYDERQDANYGTTTCPHCGHSQGGEV